MSIKRGDICTQLYPQVTIFSFAQQKSKNRIKNEHSFDVAVQTTKKPKFFELFLQNLKRELNYPSDASSEKEQLREYYACS